MGMFDEFSKKRQRSNNWALCPKLDGILYSRAMRGWNVLMYGPIGNDRGCVCGCGYFVLGLFLCLYVYLSVKYNLACLFHAIQSTVSIFYMHIPGSSTFGLYQHWPCDLDPVAQDCEVRCRVFNIQILFCDINPMCTIFELNFWDH